MKHLKYFESSNNYYYEIDNTDINTNRYLKFNNNDISSIEKVILNIHPDAKNKNQNNIDIPTYKGVDRVTFGANKAGFYIHFPNRQKDIYIKKLHDEWFFVTARIGTKSKKDTWISWKCDQIDGLIKLLETLL